MNDLNNSYIGLRHDLLKFIKNGENIILDVGCAIGTTGKFCLNNNKADKVLGIEKDEEMAELARQEGLEVFCGDLNDLDFVTKTIDIIPFVDYIILGDVLEHLESPEKILQAIKTKLKPNGRIIISLPNISHIELFIQVYIKGTFPKNQRGIFDKTHLRWFTRKDVFNLLNNTKLKLIKYDRNYRARDYIGSEFKLIHKILKILNKDLVTFQHIVVASHEK